MYTLIIIYIVVALLIGLFSTFLVACEFIMEIKEAKQRKKASAVANIATKQNIATRQKRNNRR